VAEVVGTHTIDKRLTDVERTLQLKEIKADISYFKRSYERADLHVTITGLGPEASAAAIDARLGRTSSVARTRRPRSARYGGAYVTPVPPSDGRQRILALARVGGVAARGTHR
jgi:hypothetical protein